MAEHYLTENISLAWPKQPRQDALMRAFRIYSNSCKPIAGAFFTDLVGF